MFGVGLVTFLVSKEWYVIEEEFSSGVAIFSLIYIAMKKWGPATKAYSLKLVEVIYQCCVYFLCKKMHTFVYSSSSAL